MTATNLNRPSSGFLPLAAILVHTACGGGSSPTHPADVLGDSEGVPVSMELGGNPADVPVTPRPEGVSEVDLPGPPSSATARTTISTA